MAIDPVVLDDLKWNDFNAAALLRVPAASQGLWTLNAPVDPGITLLELFGWLLEQRVYWMDQVPDDLTRALLVLLGITPQPAQAATTVLYLEPCRTGGSAPGSVNVPAQSAVRLAKGTDPPVFYTTDTVTLYTPSTSRVPRTPRVGLVVGTVDRTNDLDQNRPTPLLATDGSDTQIVLRLAAPPVPGILALLFELSTPSGLAPGWAPASGVGAPPPGPAQLTWLCSIDGTLTALDAAQIKDGTLGLRRSGIIQFPVPQGWTPNSGTTTDYALVLRPTVAQAAFPTRATRIVPNVVAATHASPVTTVPADYTRCQVETWRRLPGNVFVLPPNQRPALAPTIAVTIAEAGAPTAWTRVDDLNAAGPDDRVYVYDSASARLRFGNGVTGRLPIPDTPSSVKVGYSVVGGVTGNLGSGLKWGLVDAPAPVWVWNVVPAAGGADEETLTAVRQRAPEALASTARVITRKDFEDFVTELPGTTVARAQASIGRHPLFPNRTVPGAVTVFLVPDLPRTTTGAPDYGSNNPFPPGPEPDQPTLTAVQAALDGARLIASEVYVRPVNYRPVTLDLTVSAAPADPRTFRSNLTQALQSYFDPLVGGSDGTGWLFGAPVRPSSVLQVAQNSVGNAGTVDSVVIALDNDPATVSSCSDLSIGPDDLVVLQDVRLALRTPTPGRGGLR